MKNTYRRLYMIVLILTCATTFSYANSSWHWVSEMCPFDVLPWVVILTLTVEMMVLCKYIKEDCRRVCVYVLIANLLSFVAPFFIDWFCGDYMKLGYDFERFVSNTPRYIIGITYGLLTLAAEVPLLYNRFKKQAGDRKLLAIIVAVNAVTTAMVFAIERIVCDGTW